MCTCMGAVHIDTAPKLSVSNAFYTLKAAVNFITQLTCLNWLPNPPPSVWCLVSLSLRSALFSLFVNNRCFLQPQLDSFDLKGILNRRD